MIELLCFALAVLASPFKSKLRLEAENAVLRHQSIVLRRSLHGRVRVTNNDHPRSLMSWRRDMEVGRRPTVLRIPIGGRRPVSRNLTRDLSLVVIKGRSTLQD